jgi:UDP-galactopyranose mutase
VRDTRGEATWRKYQELMEADNKVLFTGRLGSFRYYNMDQVVAQALAKCKGLLQI